MATQNCPHHSHLVGTFPSPGGQGRTVEVIHLTQPASQASSYGAQRLLPFAGSGFIQ